MFDEIVESELSAEFGNDAVSLDEVLLDCNIDEESASPLKF